MNLLNPEQIEKLSQDLPVEWAIVSGSQLELSKKFEDFDQALAYVNKLGEIANRLNHHPDIQLSYGKVELVVTTHAVSGLTNKDFEFAKEVETIKN